MAHTRKIQAPSSLHDQRGSGWSRCVNIALRTIGRFSASLCVTGMTLTLSLAIAEVPAHSFNSPDVQRTSSAGARSWLDPLRASAKPRVAADSNAYDAGMESESDDFDLSEFSDEPGRVNTSHIFVSPDSMTVAEDSRLSEPADPLCFSASELGARQRAQQLQRKPLTAQNVFSDCPSHEQQQECWQILPQGLLYKAYLAGEKEPRMQFLSMYDTKSKRQVWDAVLGGRVGLLRKSNPMNPQADAFQLDLEGAVFARVLPEEPSSMLEGSDYRVGLYGTWRTGRTSYRAGYYHISSHVGDEYLIANPTFNRINYVRDSLLAGVSRDVTDIVRVYTELGVAVGMEGGAKPLELQLGTEYAPKPQTPATGAPFFAVNGHWRQDLDTSTSVNVVSGWGWQGVETKRRLRLGLNYYNGPSLQYEFFDRWENLVGAGIWMDY